MTKRSRSEYDDLLIVETDRERKRPRKSLFASVVDTVVSLFSPRKADRDTDEYIESQQTHRREYIMQSEDDAPVETPFRSQAPRSGSSVPLHLSHRRKSPQNDVVLPSARRPQFPQQNLAHFSHQITPADVIKSIAPSLSKQHRSIYPKQKLFDTSERHFGSAFSHVVPHKSGTYSGFAPYATHSAADGLTQQIGFDLSKPLFTLNRNISMRTTEGDASNGAKTPLFSLSGMDYTPNHVEKVTPRNLDAYASNPTYTDTAKRIIDTLEQLSTPLMDLRRMRPKSLTIKLRTKKRTADDVSAAEETEADVETSTTTSNVTGSIRKRPRVRSPSPPLADSLNISTFVVPKAAPSTRRVFASPEDERRPKDFSFSRPDDAEITQSPFSKSRIPKRSTTENTVQKEAPARFENSRVRSNLRTRRTPYGTGGSITMDEEEEEEQTFEEVTREQERQLQKIKPPQLEKPFVLDTMPAPEQKERQISPVQEKTSGSEKSTGFSFDFEPAKKATDETQKTTTQSAQSFGFTFTSNTTAATESAPSKKESAPVFSFGDNMVFSTRDKTKRKREEALSPVKEVPPTKKTATEETVSAFRFDVNRDASAEEEEEAQSPIRAITPPVEQKKPVETTGGFTFNLGATSTEKKTEESSTTGGFSFSTAPEKSSTETTGFSFGEPSKSADEDKKDTEKPAKKTGEPAFAFAPAKDAAKDATKDTTSSTETSEDGGFKFGPVSENGFSFDGFGSKKSADKEEPAVSATATGGFSFGETTSTKKKEEPATSGFTFGFTAPSASETKKDTTATTDSSAGGFTFGFDATKPAAAVSTEKAPENKDTTTGFSFSAPAAKTTEKKKEDTSDGFAGGFSFGGDAKAAAGGFTFGTSNKDTTEKKPEKTESTTTGFSFDTKPEEKKSEAPTTGGFAFGFAPEKSSTVAESKPASSGFSFGTDSNKSDVAGGFFSSAPKSTTEPTAKPSGFSFGDVTSQETFPADTSKSTPEKETSTTGGFTFGTSATTAAKPSESASTGFSFGTTAPSQLSSGTPESKPAFGEQAAKPSSGGFSFGNASESTTPAASTSGFGFSSSSAFGAPTTTSTTDKPASSTSGFTFGANSSDASNPFGAGASSSTTTSAPTFGGFSSNATTTKPESSFGGFTSSTSGFGASNDTSAASSASTGFGFNANPFSTGGSSTPGTSSPNPFGGGATSQPSQSAASSNPFGSMPNAFGSTSATSAQSGGFTFGANSRPSSAGTSGFGGPSSAGSGFSSNSGGFGFNANSGPSSAGSSAGGFGGFGANSGNSPVPFSANSGAPAAFGANSGAASFGAPASAGNSFAPSQPAFGFGNAAPAFGAPQMNGGIGEDIEHTKGRRILKARRKKKR